MSQFNAGRQGPWPSDGRGQAQRDHEGDLRDELEHAHGVKEATGSKRRRAWWPFGRRRTR